MLNTKRPSKPGKGKDATSLLFRCSWGRLSLDGHRDSTTIFQPKDGLV